MERAEAVIVGCGPAGIAAAIQLKRLGVEPLVFEKKRIGGLLVNAHLVENYPGFPGGIRGTELARLMKEHLKREGIEVALEEVTGLEDGKPEFAVRTSKRCVQTRTAIIASGTKPRDIGPLLIPDGARDRILHEVYPILETSKKSIVIVGSGDAAFDYALSLEARNHVTIVNRSARVKCLPLLWERAGSSPRITYLEKSELTDLALIDDDVLEIVCSTPGGQTKLTSDYVVFAIGREPELGFLPEAVMDLPDLLRRSEDLHLIGDARTGDMRQTAIAVGDGVMAAMKAFKRIEDLGRCM